ALYPGASSEQIEREVAVEVERALFSFKEVNRAKSYILSRDGVLISMVELNSNVEDKDIVWEKIKSRLSQLKMQLPHGVVALIANDEFGDTSALLITISSELRSYEELSRYLDVLEGHLLQVESVSNVKRYGEREEQISVYVDRAKLAHYGVDYKVVVASLMADGLTTAAGEVESDGLVLPLHFAPVNTSIEQIREYVILTLPTGEHLRVGDIARVKRELDDKKSYITHNGERSVVVSLEMREGYNVVEYGREVEQIIRAFEESLPSDVKIERIVDQPEVVSNSVYSFLRDLVVAIVIVIMVMLLLFPLHSALVAATTIPLTIFISIGVLFLVGVPLNTVTLSALIVVLGMIVDNAIVVIDGYMNYLQQGYSRWYAAVMSAQNYAGAIFVATLSLCVIFFPILFIMDGIWLDFFIDFPWAFTIALMVSYILAMLFIPVVEYRFIKPKQVVDTKKSSVVDCINRAYAWFLVRCFRLPWLTIGVGVGALVGAGALFFTLNERMFPYADRNQFAVEIYLEQGRSLRQTQSVVDSVERVLLRDDRVTSVSSFVGCFSPRFHAVYAPYIGADENYAQLIVNTISNEATLEILDHYTPLYNTHFPEAYVRFKQLDFQQAQIPYEVRLFGFNSEELKQAADSVVCALHSIPSLEWIHTSYEGSRPALSVEMDASRASRLGISLSRAQVELASIYSDIPVATVWEGDESLSVVVKSSDSDNISSIDGVRDQYISSIIPSKSVQLGQFAEVDASWKAGQLMRRGGMKSVSVYADIGRSHSESKNFKRIQKVMESRVEPNLPSGVTYSYGGTYERDEEVVPMIIKVILSGVFLIFIFLLFNYMRIKIALVALFALLFALPGAIGGLYIGSIDFGMTSILGLISLMGIIIRNVIMIFDHAESLRLKGGLSARDAAFDAGKRRMVPIFLTSATTAIGIMPMIFGSAKLWVPMGVVIFSGTIASMLLVVMILPVLYWKMYDSVSPQKDTNEEL
ncbi:MAG: efflux RND transporter permease subunit, partial [Rikenellaceae bacterium]